MKVERVIVLNWFQNFFQKLKKEDDEEFDEYDLHNLKTETSAVNSNHEGVKDLDTRISYQYPKGSIEYPIERKTRNREEQTSPITRKERRNERIKKEQAAIETVKQEQPIIKKEDRPRSRGPFQPTEIPSPVFGFNRPKKTDDLIEHELSHFSKNTFEMPIEKNELTSLKEEQNTSVIEDSSVSIGYAANVEDTKPTLEFMENVEEKKPTLEFIENPVEVLEETNEKQELGFENTETALNQAEPEITEKTHIPFNVMMLKQDKLKWEEREKNRLENRLDNKLENRLENRPERRQQTIPQPEKTVETIVKQEVVVPLPADTNDDYQFPFWGLLKPPVLVGNDTEWVHSQEEILNLTLQNFNVGASVVNVTQGPSVTRFEVQPEPGVKVNKITNLSDDIKLSLAAKDIRIEAPIPGKHTIGIEVPNKTSRPVFINEIITSQVFEESSSPLTAVLGLDISGKPVVTDLKKMPHGLIAGATGSGKSVCINTILVSLLYKARPEDVKLLLIDPKMVELAPYNHIPHLVSPVITDVKAATAALKWAVEEMERRYELFAHTGVRDINRFNELAMEHKRYSDKLPFIVIIIDELADLMMMSPADVEEAICRIAQKARACGIHLIIATQRPSVDVITGLIKANIPTRIAFSVSSQIDSRTIIDISGAEKLLGRGDMLFLENGSSKPVRLQGTFVSDEEIDLVVSHVREQREPEYLFQQEELLKKAQVTEDEDELFYEVCEFIVDHGGASTSSLQRRFKIGYNRAARLMDMLETQGFISGSNGSKPREVLITETDLEMIQDGNMIG
jgi:DNA segregation ATPase FtsK/SpoIIIE, S-DNA-T family